MQTLTKMDMVVIEDYYHTTTMNKNVNWMKLTHLLSNFPLNRKALLYIYLYIYILNVFF